MRAILRQRILSPNNATVKFVEYLENRGVKIESKSSTRRYAIVNNKTYTITITGAENDHINARQFVGDGIISLYEKNGIIYILEKSELIIGETTRELGVNFYKNAQSKENITKLKSFNKIKQFEESEYKRLYLDIADEIGKELLGRVYKKIK